MATSLEEKLLALRKAKAAATPETPARAAKLPGGANALFLGTAADKNYVPHLKHMFQGVPTYVCLEPINLISHLKMYCDARGVNRIATTNKYLLSKLLEASGKNDSDPSISDYAGSFFEIAGLQIVIISPLQQIFTVPYGRMLTARYISKLVDPNSWLEATQFNWRVLSTANIQETYDEFCAATLLACDIETLKAGLSIRCIGYTAVFYDRHAGNGTIRTVSAVLPIDSPWALTWMRKFNALPAAKIFQNGKYDQSYLLRYNAPADNWLWDTATAMHCWYSELPKDLAFLNAFFLRKVVYWKDLSETNDLHEYYKYCALDTWATANIMVAWFLRAPDWAKRNYSLEFPVVHPALYAEMTGLRQNQERLKESRTKVDAQEELLLGKLRRRIGAAAFNPGSPVQVKTLLKILGCGDLESSDEKNLKKAMIRHPLNELLLGENGILGIRGLRKLATTYLRLDSDKDPGKDNGAKDFHGRILYAINPHGTDTGRCASKEHHFWIGLQIQNIPRGPEVKCSIESEDGFYLAECDLEQAESRDTAYIAGDTDLIAAVSSSRDFHSVNASAFFGVSYESIYDDSTGKTRNKALRDLAKRVNHGANYNMGPDVLIETMGLDKIFEAARLLELNESDPRKIAYFLLLCFHKKYRKLRGGMDKPYYPGTYYAYVADSVRTHSRLTSRAYHHTEYNLRNFTAEEYIQQGDWTRYCFGNPDKSKLDLNSYVAHCPQSLNARTLNEAFVQVFYKVALPNPTTFRLYAQIHDSTLFGYKAGYEHLAEQVKDCMEIPVTVQDVSGEYRTFTVPAALKIGKIDKATGILKRARFWSETE